MVVTSLISDQLIMGEKGAVMEGKGAVTEEKGADTEQESAILVRGVSSWAGRAPYLVPRAPSQAERVLVW